MEKKNKEEKILIFSIFFIILSFFLGYFFNENSAGGGEGDFINHTWKNLQLFNSNSLVEALILTNTHDSTVFQSSRIPGFYILNKIFNPFINNAENFKLSIFTISFLVPIILYKCLSIKFENKKKIFLAFLSTLPLLSPYFRTSAIWGNEENFAYIFFIFSYFFLLKHQTCEKGLRNFYLISLIIASSFCVYLDQKFTIIPALCFLIIISSSSDFKNKLYVSFIYFLFSIPVLYVIYIWGGLLPPMDQLGRDVHLGKYNFQNFGYALTIILFYFFPFALCKINYKNIVNLFTIRNKFEKVFFIFLIIYLIYFIFFYDISSEILLGKGTFYKLSILITENYYLQKIFLGLLIFFSFRVICFLITFNFLNFFILLFLTLTPILYKPILQEYYDPMVFLLILTFLNIKFDISFKNLMILFSYFSSFLIFANLYYSII